MVSQGFDVTHRLSIVYPDFKPTNMLSLKKD